MLTILPSIMTYMSALDRGLVGAFSVIVKSSRTFVQPSFEALVGKHNTRFDKLLLAAEEYTSLAVGTSTIAIITILFNIFRYLKYIFLPKKHFPEIYSLEHAIRVLVEEIDQSSD